jgi:hypothetical protein
LEEGFAGSKKSVLFDGFARKLPFCSAGNGFKGGRAGSDTSLRNITFVPSIDLLSRN